MIGLRDSQRRTALTSHAIVVFLAGSIGGLGVALLASMLLRRSFDWVLLAGTTGGASIVAIACTRWVLLRQGRQGPAWGAITGAYAAVAIIGSLAIVTFAIGDAGPRRAALDAALLLLLATPLTAILAVVGAILSWDTDRLPEPLSQN